MVIYSRWSFNEGGRLGRFDCILRHSLTFLNTDKNQIYSHVVNVMFVCLLVFNATFNNISAISWWSVLLVEETGGTGENH